MDVRKLNAEMVAPEFFEVAGLKLALFSAKGTRAVGDKNEDSCGFVRYGGKQVALVVSDGLGGHEMGARASKIAVGTTLGKVVKKRRRIKSYEFLDRIEKSHQKILALGINAGATLVAALIEESKIRFYAVGDSSGFLISDQGEIEYKTLEHSVVGLAKEAGVLGAKAAKNHQESHVILNCLGFWDSRVETSFELELRPRNTLVLCSDGLTEVFTKKEIISKLAGVPFEHGVIGLLEGVMRRRCSREFVDDMTFILCQRI